MRAILNATGHMPGMEFITQYRPTPLLKIGDTPILFYIIEWLVHAGILDIDLILCHLPHLIEDKLEDGRRWGATLTYHLAKTSEHPFSAIRPILKKFKQENILLGRGDDLPYLTRKQFESLPPCMLLMYPHGVWSEWGIIPAEAFDCLAQDLDDNKLTDALVGCQKVDVRPLLSTRSLTKWKKSNDRFIRMKSLSTLFPLTMPFAPGGVCISRSVTIHPTAKITPPVYIGENSQIKENASLGPYAIIQKNCLIDRDSRILRSLISSRSYVGEGLDIQNCIVDRNLLINLSHETSLTISDDFILSGMPKISIAHYILSLLGRLAAGVFIILLSPLYLWLYLRHGIRKTPVVFLPAAPEKNQWETFSWLTFNTPDQTKRWYKNLPALINIIEGKAHFVGVSPLTIEKLEELPLDWKKLYLKSKIGLITLIGVEEGENPSADDRYAAEAFYTVHMGAIYDARILWKWMKTKAKSFFISLREHVLKQRSNGKL